MSGITPVLDTLLHQVLGRRVDIPVPRDMNQPVGPVVPVEGVKPLHSDSRLDARAQPQASVAGQSQAVDSARETLARPAAPPVRQPPMPAAAAPMGSTVISLSAAARQIADLLQRYPLPAAVIAPAAPLLPTATQSAGQIANQLQESIEQSGLFYEAHVARWTRGELPLETLSREPQMQVVARGLAAGVVVSSEVSAEKLSPLPQVSSTEAAVSGGEASASVSVRQGQVPLQGADALVGGEEPLESPPADVDGVAREPLAALVRQQLELLAVPQLRWEGQIWAGLFVALTIEAPPQERPSGGEGEAADPGEAPPVEWRVRLDLRLAECGELAADIRMQGEHLQLTLQSGAASLHDYFVRTGDALQESLEACGFRCVELRLLEGGEG